MDIGKESNLRSQQTSEIERIDPRLLFEGEEYEIKKKDINEELNRFYGGKNTSSFASKVGRFHGFYLKNLIYLPKNNKFRR